MHEQNFLKNVSQRIYLKELWKNLNVSVKISDDPANIPKPTFPNINLDKTITGLQAVGAMPCIYFT